jgi:hypothetical protein
VLALVAEAARDVHTMTEVAAGRAVGGYLDLLPLSPTPPTAPTAAAAATANEEEEEEEEEEEQQQQQQLFLLRHPLSRLAAWHLALLALAAGVDGGLGMPAPTVQARPRQPSFSSPRTPYDAAMHSPYTAVSSSGGQHGSLPFVEVTPELARVLLGVALAGAEVRSMLRALGALVRGAGLVASLNGGDNRYLMLARPGVAEELLFVALTFLSALAEDAPPPELHATSTLAALASRRFVEAAATYYPRPTSLLLSRFLAFGPEGSVTAAVIRALVERALDAGAMAGASGGGGQQGSEYGGGRSAYQSAAAQQHAQATQRRLVAAGARPLLAVLQAVLAVDEDPVGLQTFRLEQTLPLVERCSRLLSRHSGSVALPHELDLVWQVARMYAAVAVANPTAAAFVSTKLGAPLAEWRRLLTGRHAGFYDPSGPSGVVGKR